MNKFATFRIAMKWIPNIVALGLWMICIEKMQAYREFWINRTSIELPDITVIVFATYSFWFVIPIGFLLAYWYRFRVKKVKFGTLLVTVNAAVLLGLGVFAYFGIHLPIWRLAALM